MKISPEQLDAIARTGGRVTPPAAEVDTAVIKLMDKDLIEQVTDQVQAMPDREDMIARLKERIEAGDYRPSGDEIADAMVRRLKADRIR